MVVALHRITWPQATHLPAACVILVCRLAGGEVPPVFDVARIMPSAGDGRWDLVVCAAAHHLFAPRSTHSMAPDATDGAHSLPTADLIPAPSATPAPSHPRPTAVANTVTIVVAERRRH
jgi:hypothetical protein